MSELRKLDARCIQEIMHWGRTRASEKSNGRFDKWQAPNGKLLSYWPNGFPETDYDGWFRPSTDIAAAMEIVEKLRGDGWSFACTLYEGKLPYASFCKGTAASSRHAEAESLTEAICLAALECVKEKARATNA